MSHTYGLEFEVIDLTPRQAASAVSRAGITCSAQDSNHTTSPVCKAVRDGSLPDGSAEVVSPILTPDSLNEAQTVARALVGAGARVTKSAGFHVHMGYANIGTPALANLVVNYYAVHHATAMLVAPSRLNSRWCRVLTPEYAHRTADAIRDANFSFGGAARYYSLNLNSVDRHGTVEFRLHQGTLNATKALAWVNYLTALVNHSANGENWEHYAQWEAMPALERVSQVLMDYGLTERNRNYLLTRANELQARQA